MSRPCRVCGAESEWAVCSAECQVEDDQRPPKVIAGRYVLEDGPRSIQYPDGYRCGKCGERSGMTGHEACFDA